MFVEDFKSDQLSFDFERTAGGGIPKIVNLYVDLCILINGCGNCILFFFML